MLSIGIPHIPKLRVPQFSAAQMRTIGDYAVRLERGRVSRAINARDQPAKPLSRPYQRQKRRAGRPAQRDCYLTGGMMASRTVISASGGMAVIGFSDQRYYERAGAIEQVEGMLGISLQNQRALDRFILAMRPATFKLAA